MSRTAPKWAVKTSERGIEIKGPRLSGCIALGMRKDKTGVIKDEVEVIGLVDGSEMHVWVRMPNGTKRIIGMQRAWEAYGEYDPPPSVAVHQPELPVRSVLPQSDLHDLVVQMSMEAQAERQVTADAMATTRRKLSDIETELRARNQLIDELTKTLQTVLQRLQPIKEVRDA